MSFDLRFFCVLMSVSFGDATNHVIVVDTMFGLLDTRLERAKTPSDGEAERTATVPRHLIVTVITIHCLCFRSHVLIEWCISTDAYRQAVALEEGTLQRGVIVLIGVLHSVDG